MGNSFWEGFTKEAGAASAVRKGVKGAKGMADASFGTKLKESLSLGKSKAQEGYGKAKDWAKKNPKSAVGIGAGAAGLAGGYAAGKSKSNNSVYGY